MENKLLPCKTIDCTAKHWANRDKTGCIYAVKITIDYQLASEKIYALSILEKGDYRHSNYWRVHVLNELQRIGYTPELDPSDCFAWFLENGIIARWYLHNRCTYQECAQWLKLQHEKIASRAMQIVDGY